MIELNRILRQAQDDIRLTVSIHRDGVVRLVTSKKIFSVYIMSNEHRTTYIGVTSDLERRVWEHRVGRVPGFTSRYGLRKLVHVESFEGPVEAIAREKQLKGWRRSKKLDLINSQNPQWSDLAADWFE